MKVRWLLIGLGLFSWVGCRPIQPKRKEAGSRIAARIKARSCPHKYAYTLESLPLSIFRNFPCQLADDRSDCPQEGCVPDKLDVSIQTTPESFFAQCDLATVLCVGPSFAVKTLTEAAKRFKANQGLTKILVAPGRYEERVVFSDLKRVVRIEGASNDPSKGTILAAPPSTQPLKEADAALVFQKVNGVILNRFVITGGQHGVLVEDASQVQLNWMRFEGNRGSGARGRRITELLVRQSQFLQNGHPTEGSRLYRFGLVLEGVKGSTIQTNLFAYNGAGGLLLWPTALPLAKDGARVSLEQALQTPQQGTELRLIDNAFRHNGPITGNTTQSGTPCRPQSCQEGDHCEAGRCRPDLTLSSSDSKALLGVGAAIAGQAFAQISGNQFAYNDTSGLLTHSMTRLLLHENAFLRNGVRPLATVPQLRQFAAPAARVWHIRLAFEGKHNLFSDNAGTGLSFIQELSPPQLASVKLVENHFSGNGRFTLSQEPPLGDGASFVVAPGTSMLRMSFFNNYFTANGRTGLLMRGTLRGSLSDNLFEDHPHRALLWLDTGNDSEQRVSFQYNTVNKAHMHAIQIQGGKAKLLLDGNSIRNTSPDDQGAADGIHLSQLTGPRVVLTNNRISGHQRAGIVIDAATAYFFENIFTDNGTAIISQNQASFEGEPSVPPTSPTTPLPPPSTP